LSTETPAPKKFNGTPTVRKFMFERSFDDAEVVLRTPERKPILMKPDQIDTLKKESYDAGFSAGKAEGHEEQITQQTIILKKLDQDMSALVAHLAAIVKEQEEHTRELALAIARKVIPVFTAKGGLDEIESLINDTIRDMTREPRLVMRVHEAEYEALNEKIKMIAERRAYSGTLVLVADPDVAAGDCRIEWTDGGVARDTPATMAAVETTLISPSS